MKGEIFLNVSDIQRFSVGDGDGIRTTVFLKECNLRCPWCHNPETLSAAPVELAFAGSGERRAFGRKMTAAEVAEIAAEDADFYRASGGGVTASGGEPLLQAEGVAALGAALAEKDVSLAVDTAGCVPFSAFERVLPVVSFFLFDWKAPTAEAYRAIGGDYDRIGSNLTRLLALADVRVRVPLIEGFNSGEGREEVMCECLKKAGAKRVDLLPFHRLGSGKYAAMGREYAYRDVPPMTPARAEEIARTYRKYFQVSIEK